MKTLITLVLVLSLAASYAAQPLPNASRELTSLEMSMAVGSGVNCAKAWGAMETLAFAAGYLAAAAPAGSLVLLGAAAAVGAVIVLNC